MSTFNRPIVRAAGALLFAMAVSDSSAAASFTSKPAGFLTEVPQRLPSADGGAFSAGLPHLRLEIALARVENEEIAGSGIVGYAYPYASVKIMSNAADVSIPAAAVAALEFPTPPSGNAWNVADNASYAASVNPLFVGVIENGCLGAPAMFDLSLDGAILLPDRQTLVGEVHLADSVFGTGHYDLDYTIRATDADGNSSDIRFIGHAESYCTTQLGNAVAIDPSKISGSTATFRATQGTAAADSVTCRPASSNWCANGFQLACDRSEGGLSTEPDGGITCTYPEHESAARELELTTEQRIVPPSPALGFRQTSRPQTAAWVSLTCNGDCEWFVQACDRNGGGLSSEPDGGSTCTIQDDTCSGCD